MSEKTIGMLQGFILSLVVLAGGCSILGILPTAIPFLDAAGGPQSDETISIDRFSAVYPDWVLDEPDYHKEAREVKEQQLECNKHTPNSW